MKYRSEENIEASLDNEFEKLGVKVHVMHVLIVPPQARGATIISSPHIQGVTLVSSHKLEYDVVDHHIRDVLAGWEFGYPGSPPAAKFLLVELQDRGYLGVDVCAAADVFNNRAGRIAAKRRLISHLIQQQREESL